MNEIIHSFHTVFVIEEEEEESTCWQSHIIDQQYNPPQPQPNQICTYNSNINKQLREMSGILELPFKFYKVPSLRLKTPTFSYPSPMKVFVIVFVTYFLVSSGIIYDFIVQPPSIGYSQDERGVQKPSVFQMYRVNGQFIIEGLSAGFIFALGAIGFILSDLNKDKNNNYIFIAALVLIVASYNIAIVFLRMKIPNYGFA
ncbi:hypothetical protein DFA_04751 [Cavenderia fasciculata]|uniref:Oligosaccharyltransferase complex subunit n=1 Tax=Cavenderia fasciculata TaxID=261658 RepID=F4PQF8_CACFS|nr:uncharacterized protein DFA_04751 [Cavenderia fasciculata]EGG22621.1 hypothetical protein DFA_04751 [Cavenderia fasciculata]|eukprot:XP_004360472.1 hypothetical protein DFA_04751 [Cavenderia fasciculata]